MEGIYLNLTPAVYSNPKPIYSTVKRESFPSNIRNKTRIPTLTTFIEQKGSGFGEIFLKNAKRLNMFKC